MKVFKIIFILCVFQLILAGSAQSQLFIDGGLYNNNLQIFSLDDLNFSDPSSGPLLFWLKIRNEYNEEKSAILSLSIESANYGTLASGKTRPFRLEANESISINNRNLGSVGSRFELDEYTISDVAGDLTESILSSGSLPSDEYQFNFSLEELDEQPEYIPPVNITVNITNPTTIELVSPGRSVDEGELPVLFSALPQFVWESNATEFTLTVCEKMPFNSAPEEVMENEPRFKKSISNVNNVIYPSSGAYPLEEGHTYYWQIVANVTTSGGLIEIPSEIWGFRIGTTQNIQQSSQITMIRNSLQRLLGENETIEELFRKGFIPTGVMYYKGSPINLQDLQDLIQKKSMGELEIIDYEIE